MPKTTTWEPYALLHCIAPAARRLWVCIKVGPCSCHQSPFVHSTNKQRVNNLLLQKSTQQQQGRHSIVCWYAVLLPACLSHHYTGHHTLSKTWGFHSADCNWRSVTTSHMLTAACCRKVLLCSTTQVFSTRGHAPLNMYTPHLTPLHQHTQALPCLASTTSTPHTSLRFITPRNQHTLLLTFRATFN